MKMQICTVPEKMYLKGNATNFTLHCIVGSVPDISGSAISFDCFLFKLSIMSYRHAMLEQWIVFQIPVPTLPTMQQSDITGGNF